MVAVRMMLPDNLQLSELLILSRKASAHVRYVGNPFAPAFSSAVMSQIGGHPSYRVRDNSVDKVLSSKTSYYLKTHHTSLKHHQLNLCLRFRFEQERSTRISSQKFVARITNPRWINSSVSPTRGAKVLDRELSGL